MGRRSKQEDGADEAPRAWWKRAIDIGLWVVVLGLLVYRFGPQVGAAIGIGETDLPAPDFTVQTVDGDTLRLSELRGRVVLVNFWATWCPPCRVEMPGFQRVWEDYRDRGVVIIGLTMDRDVDILRWIRGKDITYPIAFATPEITRAFGGASVLPTSILINRDGRIVHRVEGLFAEPTLRASIKRLLD